MIDKTEAQRRARIRIDARERMAEIHGDTVWATTNLDFIKQVKLTNMAELADYPQHAKPLLDFLREEAQD